ASSGSTPRSKVTVHEHRHAQKPRAEVRPTRSPQRAAVETGEEADVRSPRHATRPRRRAGRPAAGSLRRPVVETAASGKPAGLDAGHEARPDVPAEQPRRESSSPLLELP